MSARESRSRATRRAGVGAAAVACMVLVGTMVVAAQDLELDLPGFLSAEEQQPVFTPEAGQEVVVLQVDLESDGQRVSAEVRSQEVITSFAPKSVARSAGEWEVRISGERELTYQIPNPLLDIEVENPDDRDSPFEMVPTDGYEWTLIVPLYHEGEPLGATAIQVVDIETGETILETDVRQ